MVENLRRSTSHTLLVTLEWTVSVHS